MYQPAYSFQDKRAVRTTKFARNLLNFLRLLQEIFIDYKDENVVKLCSILSQLKRCQEGVKHVGR